MLLLLNVIFSKRILLLRPLDLPRVSVSYVFPCNLSPCALPRSRKHGTQNVFFCCWGSVCGGVDIFFLRFLVCRSPAAWRSFFFVAGGRSATSAVFFRSPAAWRSFFFFALVLRGVRFFAFYNPSTVILAFVIFLRFVLKRNPVFYKLKAYFFSKKRIEINKNQ